MIRVAMLPLLPPSSAATRAFCVRPAELLRRQGIAADVFAPSTSDDYLRLAARTGSTRRVLGALYWYGRVAPRRLAQLARALSYDVVFVQRGLFRPTSPPVLEALLWLGTRASGSRIVYHCDDSLHAVARSSYYRARFRMADVAVTGSAEVADLARQVHSRVGYLSAGLPLDRYPVRRHEPRSEVVIGWVGSYAGDFLGPLLPALREVARVRTIRFRVVSQTVPKTDLSPGVLDWRLWRPEDEFAAFEDLDIGVMPLEDTPYARGKEAYKIKEYMAAGLAVVCSPVGTNVAVVEDGVDGLFASTTAEWRDALLRLVDDHRLRARLGAAARRKAEEAFGIERSSRRLARVLLLAAGTANNSNGSSACAE